MTLRPLDVASLALAATVSLDSERSDKARRRKSADVLAEMCTRRRRRTRADAAYLVDWPPFSASHGSFLTSRLSALRVTQDDPRHPEVKELVAVDLSRVCPGPEGGAVLGGHGDVGPERRLHKGQVRVRDGDYDLGVVGDCGPGVQDGDEVVDTLGG